MLITIVMRGYIENINKVYMFKNSRYNISRLVFFRPNDLNCLLEPSKMFDFFALFYNISQYYFVFYKAMERFEYYV